MRLLPEQLVVEQPCLLFRAQRVKLRANLWAQFVELHEPDPNTFYAVGPTLNFISAVDVSGRLAPPRLAPPPRPSSVELVGDHQSHRDVRPPVRSSAAPGRPPESSFITHKSSAETNQSGGPPG